jgi:hypothetical protein
VTGKDSEAFHICQQGTGERPDREEFSCCIAVPHAVIETKHTYTQAATAVAFNKLDASRAPVRRNNSIAPSALAFSRHLT